MADPVQIIVGIGIIIINLIPFAVKQPRYLLVTSIVSLLAILLLIFVQ